MVFENGVKNIQAAAYNGASTVPYFEAYVPCIFFSTKNLGPKMAENITKREILFLKFH